LAENFPAERKYSDRLKFMEDSCSCHDASAVRCVAYALIASLCIGLLDCIHIHDKTKCKNYTMSQIKRRQVYFYDNFGKCGRISTIWSLLHLMINYRRGRIKCCHLASYLLPLYLV